jgi:hypothetical protein
MRPTSAFADAYRNFNQTNNMNESLPAELENMSDGAREKIAAAIRNAKEPPPEFPRVNTYVCKRCDHVTHTVDVAEGTTTMILPCMAHTQSRIVLVTGEKATHCNGEMLSTFYAVDPDNFDLGDVEFEWRYSTLPEYQGYKAKGLAIANHVADGGLVLHKRSNRNAPMFTHGGFYVREDGTRLTDGEVANTRTGLQTLKEVVRLDMEKAKRKRHQKMLEGHISAKKRKNRRGRR